MEEYAVDAKNHMDNHHPCFPQTHAPWEKVLRRAREGEEEEEEEEEEEDEDNIRDGEGSDAGGGEDDILLPDLETLAQKKDVVVSRH